MYQTTTRDCVEKNYRTEKNKCFGFCVLLMLMGNCESVVVIVATAFIARPMLEVHWRGGVNLRRANEDVCCCYYYFFVLICFIFSNWSSSASARCDMIWLVFKIKLKNKKDWLDTNNTPIHIVHDDLLILDINNEIKMTQWQQRRKRRSVKNHQRHLERGCYYNFLQVGGMISSWVIGGETCIIDACWWKTSMSTKRRN